MLKHQSHVDENLTLTIPISDTDSIFNKLLGLLSDNNSFELDIFKFLKFHKDSLLCFSASICNCVIDLSASNQVERLIKVFRSSAYFDQESHQLFKLFVVSENKDLTNPPNQLDERISQTL
jgi:hypothetical protein